jgi:hypothetical protein
VIERWREAALVAVIAVIATIPALLPGAEAYVDNGPHLVELRAWSEAILVHDHSWVGWDDRAQAGQAVGQLNAPLVWGVLGLLIAAGAPLIPTYLLGVPLANAVLGVGVWRLAREYLPAAGAVAAGALAACMVQDLYGIGGAAGGMWPFRLANGVLLLGMVSLFREPRAALHGAWLAALLLLHSFTAVVAVTWVLACVAAQLVSRRPTDALRTGGALAVALGVTAAFWVPLLDGALRPLDAPIQCSALQVLRLFVLPQDPFSVILNAPDTLGGGAALVGTAAVFGGALLALALPGGRARLAQAGPALRWIAGCVLALVLMVGLVIPLTGFSALGPNPWRYLAFWRIGLCILAGVGVVALPKPRVAAAALVALCVPGPLVAGLQELPLRSQHRAVWEAAEASWDDAAGLPNTGRVYLENTSQNPGAPERFQRGHLQTLFGLHHDVPQLGSWYGHTPTPTQGWTTSEGGVVLAARPEQLREETGPDWLNGRLRIYGVGAVVSHSDRLAAVLQVDPRYRLVSEHPPFSVWQVVEPAQPQLGVHPERGRVVELETGRGWAVATIEGSADIPFRLRQSYHPWWTATLDGAPLELAEGPDDGLVTGVLPGPGRLELRWVDQGRWAWWLSLVGGLAWIGLAFATRAGRASD